MEEKKEMLNNPRTLVLTALLFAIAIVLSFFENSLPPFLAVVPGVKLGISNIVVMYVLFFLGKKQAYAVAILKSVFVFITRGYIASFLSLFGGLLSITVMLLLLFFYRDKISYLLVSISGAVFHNIGQFIAISIVYTGMNVVIYLPVLIISGIVAGIATSVLLRFILPAFKRLGIK